MQIPLADLQAASQCFRYYHFLKTVEPKPTNRLTDITQKVMQKCYLKASETGFKAEWRQIIGWVDARVFRDVDIHNDGEYKTAKRHSEYILLFLYKWYRNIYLPGTGVGYVNIALEKPITYRHIVQATAPLVTLEDIPYLVMVGDKVQVEYELRRDLYVQGLAWMIADELDLDKIGIQYFCLKVQGGFDVTSFLVKERYLSRIKSAVNQVAQLVGSGVNFPSYTEQCESCPFKRRCRI